MVRLRNAKLMLTNLILISIFISFDYICPFHNGVRSGMKALLHQAQAALAHLGRSRRASQGESTPTSDFLCRNGFGVVAAMYTIKISERPVDQLLS